jgi:hypothetical protein
MAKYPYETYEDWMDTFVPFAGGKKWDDVTTVSEIIENIKAVQNYKTRTTQGNDVFKAYFGFDITKDVFGKDMDDVAKIEQAVKSISRRTKIKDAFFRTTKETEDDIVKEATYKIKTITDAKELGEYLTDVQQGEDKWGFVNENTRDAVVEEIKKADTFSKMGRIAKERYGLTITEKIPRVRNILNNLENSKRYLPKDMYKKDYKNATRLIKSWGFEGINDARSFLDTGTIISKKITPIEPVRYE